MLFFGFIACCLPPHIWILKNTLTPLHDHVRKRKGWSDEQVVARWLILQCVASALLLLLVRG